VTSLLLRAALPGLIVAVLSLSGCDRPMAELPAGPATAALPAAPAPAPAPPVDLARQHYRNVPALGQLPREAFDRSMQAMTAWVAPQDGCTHCHVDGDMASDAKPAKQTARRMLEMVQHLNANWKPHVGQVGVTCHTCHRGQARPPPQWTPPTSAAAPAEPSYAAFLTQPVMAERLDGDAQADAQYGLMLHYSEALAVDCRLCHAQAGKDGPSATQSGSLRSRAASGLRLLQDINAAYLGRPGTTASARKRSPATAGSTPAAAASQAHCGTCHQGRRDPAADGAPRAQDHPALTLAPPDPDAPAGSDAARCARVALEAARLGTRIPAESGTRGLRGGPTLALYAAPDPACRLFEVHLLAGDQVETFVSHAGYASVRYRRTDTGSEARGWVALDRLGPVLAAAQHPLPGAPGPADVRTALAPTRPGCEPLSPSPAAGGAPAPRQVLGQGRLQFYAAPDEACPLRGVFILPGEPVVALQELPQFTAVHYVNPRTGNQAAGWVRSARLGGS
jgi:photosynthetic reaction center cytochrome c subunit